ncbi:MAG: YaaA family protein [Desulforhopalus sp.]
MKIITSPSKTQLFNGREFADHSLPMLLPMTEKIIDRLRTLSFAEISSMMKTSEKLTANTLQRIKDFSTPLSPETAKQALFMFQGDAYSSIAAEHYTATQLHHAQHHLYILSGLYGILRPLDLMLPYRLEMGCPLAVGGAANLYHYWRDRVTEVIHQGLAADPVRLLINLASTEYSKVIDLKKLGARMVTIIFKQPHKGTYRTVPIYAKRARGKFIHFMITNGIDTAAQLKEFTLDHYHFSKRESTEEQYHFLQES